MIASRVRIAAAAVAALGLAACTSSGGNDPTAPASPTDSGPTNTSVSASPAPAGFAPVDGAYLVVGPTADSADVYRVASGRLQRVTSGAHVTTVTAEDGTVVVGREQGGKELVQRLRSGRPTDLGIGSGFAPALSDDGALAWVSLDGPGSTPGISKPKGFTVHVRPSLTGKERAPTTFPNSVGGLQWTDQGLVAAIAAGDRARLVRFPAAGGAPRTLATIAGGDDLDVTADDSAFTVSSGDGYVLVSASGRQSFPTGWRPLCWSDDDEVLAAKAGRLATVAIDRGRAGPPELLGSLPAGTTAFGGACG